MSNLKQQQTEVNADAVVKNDAAEAIKASSNQAVQAKPASSQTPLARLQSMEVASRNWQSTELAASNKRLYSILTDAYEYYLAMKTGYAKSVRAQYAKDLQQFIEQRKYVFAPTSHDMTRVVKCVFGVDRRRVSAYSIALREALRQKVQAADLCAFIEQNGGVEQIRLGGSKPLSAKMRAEKVKDEVFGADLGSIRFDARFVRADADWADKQVVIVATYLPTGEFQANAVIRHDTAVNAALAAYYSKQQAALQANKTAKKAIKASLKVNAGKSSRAVAKNAKKQAAAKVQQAQGGSVSKRVAANLALHKALFEEVGI